MSYAIPMTVIIWGPGQFLGRAGVEGGVWVGGLLAFREGGGQCKR